MLTKKLSLAGLLSFNSGFVDTVGFFGLQGLFAAHVTGNFVTMGSTLVFGAHGIIGKVLVLPEFAIVVALSRWAGLYLSSHQKPVVQPLLGFHLLFLIGFFGLAVGFGPFANADSPAALAASFMAVASMAILNAVQRVYLTDLPPITIMTGNTTQASLDAVDLVLHRDPEKRTAIKTRLVRALNSMLFFALGCASGILSYFHVGFWNLSVSVAVGVACVALGEDRAA